MQHEEIMTKFMDALKAKQLPGMDLVTKTWRDDHEQKDMRRLVDLRVMEWKILKYEEISKVMIRYTVLVRDRAGSVRINLMMVRERGVRKPSIIGSWGVNPISWRAEKRKKG